MKIIYTSVLFFLFFSPLYGQSTADSLCFTLVKHPLGFGFIVADSARNPDVIIIHSSYCPSQSDSFNLNCILKLYKKYDVSAHYIIDREGVVYQLIDEGLIAHHGGKGMLPDGSVKINTRSIGIELVNTQTSFYTEAQYLALAELVKEIKKRREITYILGHKDIAPQRKSDPWNFDWTKFFEYFR